MGFGRFLPFLVFPGGCLCMHRRLGSQVHMEGMGNSTARMDKDHQEALFRRRVDLIRRRDVVMLYCNILRDAKSYRRDIFILVPCF